MLHDEYSNLQLHCWNKFFSYVVQYHQVSRFDSWFDVHMNNWELNQQESWKTWDGKMMKKCGTRLCIPNLTQHFFVILPYRVFQLSCCVSLYCLICDALAGLFCQRGHHKWASVPLKSLVIFTRFCQNCHICPNHHICQIIGNVLLFLFWSAFLDISANMCSFW